MLIETAHLNMYVLVEVRNKKIILLLKGPIVNVSPFLTLDKGRNCFSGILQGSRIQVSASGCQGSLEVAACNWWRTLWCWCCSHQGLCGCRGQFAWLGSLPRQWLQLIGIAGVHPGFLANQHLGH